MKNKALPVFLAFLCMGFGDAVGPFVGLAKASFQLSNTMAQLIVFMGFIMFGLLSIPLGVMQSRTGKKKILLLGLVLAFAGLIIPAIAGLTTYPAFLLTILLLGSGAAALQVSGNPMMRDVSPEGKYSRNLSFSQFIKAIGSLSGPVLPALAAYYHFGDWKIVFPVYSAFLLLTIIAVSFLKADEQKTSSASMASCLSLLGNMRILFPVMAIFLYVGAEVCMSSGIPIYMKSVYHIDLSTMGMLGTGMFFLALTIGRFLGGVILGIIKPRRFFVITGLISGLGLLLLFAGNYSLSIAGILLTGLGFANIFPLIFSMTVDAMPEKSSELSGLMVTAIVGGALIPPIMGLLADMTNTMTSLLVPLAALILLFMLVMLNFRRMTAR